VRRTLELAEIEAAYRAHGAAFERVAIAIAGDEGLGRDAVQEAFVRAIRRRRTFRSEAPLVAWLWRVVLNEARRRRQRFDEELLPEHEPAHLPADDDTGAVRARIAALPERQRLALFLRYYADLDYNAIATALEIRPGTVAATLNAARRRLHHELQEVEKWTS